MRRYSLLSLALASTIAMASGCSRVENDSEMPYKPTASNSTSPYDVDTNTNESDVTAADSMENDATDPIVVRKPISDDPVGSPDISPQSTIDQETGAEFSPPPLATESLDRQPLDNTQPLDITEPRNDGSLDAPGLEETEPLDIPANNEPQGPAPLSTEPAPAAGDDTEVDLLDTEVDIDVEGANESVKKLDQTKDEFIADTEDQLKKLDRKYAEMKERASEISEDAQEEFNARLNEIEKERKELMDLLAEVQEANEDTWAEMQQGIADAWEDLRISTEKTEDEFRLEVGDLKINVDDEGLKIDVRNEDDPQAEGEGNEGTSVQKIIEDAEESTKEVIEDAASVVEELEEATTDVVDEASEAAEDTTEAATDTAEKVEAAAEDVADEAKEATEDVSDEAEEAADETSESLEETTEEVSDEAKDVVDEAADEADETLEEAEDAVEETSAN